VKELKWTTYDGTAETLPPVGFTVAATDGDYTVGGLRRSGTTFLDDTDGNRVWCLKANNRWLPIPTQEQLDALQAELTVLRAVAEALRMHLGLIPGACNDHDARNKAFAALAKLDALKKGDG
jgi:hypothetical protein